MEQRCHRIGVLTSGGDAPGMNAAIRAVTDTAIGKGMEVMGIYEGYAGLIHREMKLLCRKEVADIGRRGGTVLYTARCDAFREIEGRKQALAVCRESGIDALIVIGGDGTLRGARELWEMGFPCVGIPGSIDNDVAASEETVGFDTAVNTAISLMDRLRDTSESHARCNIIEVMGRSSGQIALSAGIGAGAAGIAIAELPFAEEEVLHGILHRRSIGTREFLVVVAEGMRQKIPDFTESLARRVREATGIETRTTVLGHVVRGGSPTARDRQLASEMGAYAVSLLEQGQAGLGVLVQNGRLCTASLAQIETWSKTYQALLRAPAPQSDEAAVCQVRLQTLKERYALAQALQKR